MFFSPAFERTASSVRPSLSPITRVGVFSRAYSRRSRTSLGVHCLPLLRVDLDILFGSVSSLAPILSAAVQHHTRLCEQNKSFRELLFACRCLWSYLNIDMLNTTSSKPTLGSRIRDKRVELRWTQDELAEKAGLSKGFLSDLENSNRSIGAERLLDLARVLGLSLDYLMKGEIAAAIQTQIVIPQKLADFAKHKALPFNQTLTLLDMRRQIIAHRSATKSDNPEDFNWEGFYKSVKDFLP